MLTAVTARDVAPVPEDERATTIALLSKYDRPGPRYTSYPTAVEFTDAFDETAYRRQLARASARRGAPLSLYIHLPFCEERCSFCGCSVIITKKHEVANRYLEYLVRELEMLAGALGPRRRLAQYHWGGGTPTYLDPGEMRALHAEVTRQFEIDPGAEVAIEVDPRVTSDEHLDTLCDLGFNRLSLGIQDFTPEVQVAVNRVQPEDQTRRLFDRARALGFHSINADLIYGLPLQTTPTFARTIDAVLDMRPDRVAVYSFAHVPWVRSNQKRIKPEDLPSPALKIELFAEARARFLGAGYQQIGMDHFSVPGDDLARAAAAGTLHRNFMGYTTRPANDLVGVGVSAIGDVDDAFSQNVKKLSTYYAALDAGRFPVERGFLLDEDDRIRRFVITNLMCNMRVDRAEVARRFGVSFDTYFARELDELSQGPVAHGLAELDDEAIRVLPRGRLFVRNICMTFDRYLRRQTTTPVFSRTV